MKNFVQISRAYWVLQKTLRPFDRGPKKSRYSNDEINQAVATILEVLKVRSLAPNRPHLKAHAP